MSGRLLYVEDDEDLRRLFGVMLRKEGYEVEAVSNAEDAVVELQKHAYQVLLTDYNLPNKNADWMLQVAGANGSLRSTAVVVLTAARNPEGVGGYRVLRKPIDVAELFAALDEAIGLAPRTVGAGCSDAAGAAPGVLLLTLYVTGTSRESQKALRTVQRALTKFEADAVQLSICDVEALSEAAAAALEDDRIVVTPTLVRHQPLPKIWLLGDLANVELVEELIADGIRAAGR